MNRAATDSHPKFTPKQGQYLAFIHAYTVVNGRPPAEADMQRFFRVTPPSVHQMVVTLELRDGSRTNLGWRGALPFWSIVMIYRNWVRVTVNRS